MIVIAAILISFGTGRQIFASSLDVVTTNRNAFLSFWASTLLLLAKNRTTGEWRSVESQVQLIIINTRAYNLPVKLDGVTPESQILLEYWDEHKWELHCQHAVTYDNSSFLAFAQYATKQMMEKLKIYVELEELQERSGGINSVILIAL